jgi:rSAM/selenodomain-associated transferase 1
MNKDLCLIMFAKYPEKDKVKTRLSRYWDEDAIVRLSRCFIEDMLDRLSGGDYRFRIAYHPVEKKIDFIKQFGDGFSFMPQIGKDLGERMHNTFRQCFSEGLRSVVVIGSDSPDLPPQIIRDAFQALETHGAVIGPACDGGYYLIGFSRDSFSPGAFDGISWGTGGVFRETVRILKEEGIRLHVLPAWRDIDRPEDIVALIKDSKETDFATSRTMAYLKELGLTEIT